METQPRFARLAQKVLVDEPIDELPASNDAEDRAIAALADAIGTRVRAPHPRRWTTFALVAAAAVAVIAVGAGVRYESLRNAPSAAPIVSATAGAVHGDVHVLQGQTERSLGEGQPLVAGDRLLLPRESDARVMLSTGTRLQIEGGSDLTVVDQGPAQRFHLASGSMHLDVAKLHPGERFLVRTGDAEIEVRGTSFQVTTAVKSDPACGGGTTTRVVVREGVVSVRVGANEARVAAGESWPSGCETAPTIAPSQSAPTAQVSPPPSADAPPSVAPRSKGSQSKPPSASDLAAQNDALAAAVSAKRRGDSAAALGAFDHFLATYPGSPLTETAVVERMKLLAATRPARGLQAARDYIARYPRGFARADAEAILEGGL